MRNQSKTDRYLSRCEAAEYLVFAEARGRGPKEGFHAVNTSREIRYRISLPQDANKNAPLPVLIWLAEEGLRAADAEDYWRAALGDPSAAPAAIRTIRS